MKKKKKKKKKCALWKFTGFVFVYWVCKCIHILAYETECNTFISAYNVI